MFNALFGGKKSASEKTHADNTPTSGGINKLTQAVSLTSKSLIGQLLAFGGQEGLDEDTLDNIEETLIRADVGVDVAMELTDKLRKNKAIHTPEQLKAFLKDEFTRILAVGSNTLTIAPDTLTIVMVVGVNGAGKTTLIGKLSHRLIQQGHNVVIAAADTFRAAAEDQIEIWAQRAGADLVRLDTEDPAAVVFDALKTVQEKQANVLIIDTAGRLQNKFNLMEELKKMKGIIDKETPQGYHYEGLLVLDATTGQNALRQAEVFHEAADITGVGLTKLDGSAKGGVVFNIAKTYQLPVKLIGVGEGIEDLKDFEPAAFIDALFV